VPSSADRGFPDFNKGSPYLRLDSSSKYLIDVVSLFNLISTLTGLSQTNFAKLYVLDPENFSQIIIKPTTLLILQYFICKSFEILLSTRYYNFVIS
jgi:hypothetical protein